MCATGRLKNNFAEKKNTNKGSLECDGEKLKDRSLIEKGKIGTKLGRNIEIILSLCSFVMNCFLVYIFLASKGPKNNQR